MDWPTEESPRGWYQLLYAVSCEFAVFYWTGSGFVVCHKRGRRYLGLNSCLSLSPGMFTSCEFIGPLKT